MVSLYPVVKAMHHVYIYITSLYLPVKGNNILETVHIL